MIARSYLFVPGDRPDRFAKARSSGAHVIMLDLEDAVAADRKAAAREAVGAWLAAQPTGDGAAVYLRVNAPSSPHFAPDLALLSQPGIAGVVVPKVEAPGELDAVVAAYAGTGSILPMIESAQGLAQAQAIAAHPRVARLIFGSWDFQLDLGIPDDDLGLLFARSHLVLASRLAGVLSPVDGVTAALDDPAALARDIARARQLGFGGKLCIHPKQIAVVNAGFGPTAAELAWARQIRDAVAAQGEGAQRAAGQMVDRPVIARAQAILDETSE